MSAKLRGCVARFIYFLDLLQVRYNCAKFYHCRMSHIIERGAFLNQQICLIKYLENEISNSTSLPKKKRDRGAKIIFNLNSKTPEKLSLFTLYRYLHYHYTTSLYTLYYLYRLWSDPEENLKKIGVNLDSCFYYLT